MPKSKEMQGELSMVRSKGGSPHKTTQLEGK